MNDLSHASVIRQEGNGLGTARVPEATCAAQVLKGRHICFTGGTDVSFALLPANGAPRARWEK